MDWEAYYKVTSADEPRKLLREAIDYIPHTGRALDLGSGNGRDTKYLLRTGFAVDAVDSSPEAEKFVPSEANFYLAAFDSYRFPKDTYELVNAEFSLPFNSPQTFTPMFEELKRSLKAGGLFVGQFFGRNDSWATDSTMTFHSAEDIRDALTAFSILKLQEEQREGETALGQPKRWHIFNVIARKN